MPSALSTSKEYFDLPEAAVGVRQWQGGEQAEPAGMVLDDLHRVVVERARKPASLLHVAEKYPGRGHRNDGGLDAVLVHRRKRRLRRPPVPGGNDAAAALRRDPVFHFLEPERRHDMMMHVDELGSGFGRRLRQCGGRGQRGAGAEGARSGQKLPPRWAADPAALPVPVEYVRTARVTTAQHTKSSQRRFHRGESAFRFCLSGNVPCDGHHHAAADARAAA